MRTRILAAITPIAVALAILVGSSSTPAAGPWEGIYRVEGVNPTDGSKYTGAVQIDRVPDTDLYQLIWVIDSAPGEIAMVAVGFVFDDRLVATGLQAPMPIIFKANGDGRWVIPAPGVRTPGRERLTRTKFKTLREALPAAPTPAPSRRIPSAGPRRDV